MTATTGDGLDLPTFLFDSETNRAVHDALPGVVIDILSVLTHLGDGTTITVLAVLLYWFGSERNRQSRAMVLAVAVSTLALVAGLKGILEIQRPLYVADPPFGFAPDEYTGYSTPSAHSMGAAAVYGALAAVMKVGKRWQRYTVAGFIIAAVALSRVVMGLHYVGDVVSGVVLGLLLVVLALQFRKSRDSVLMMFGLALVIAVAGFVLGSREFTTMAVGTSLGGLVGWYLVRDIDADPWGSSLLLLGIAVLPFLLVLRVVDRFVTVGVHVEIVGVGEVPFMAFVETLGFAVVFGLVVALPVIAHRLNGTPAVVRLQTLLPLEGRTVEAESAGEKPETETGTETE